MLALIALALQVVLTFGHVHLGGLGGSSHRVIAGQASLAHPAAASSGANPKRRRLLRDLRVDFSGVERIRASAAATTCPREFSADRASLQCRTTARRTVAARFPIARSARGLKLRSC